MTLSPPAEVVVATVGSFTLPVSSPGGVWQRSVGASITATTSASPSASGSSATSAEIASMKSKGPQLIKMRRYLPLLLPKLPRPSLVVEGMAAFLDFPPPSSLASSSLASSPTASSEVNRIVVQTSL